MMNIDRDALEIMVENINLGDEVERLNKTIDEMEQMQEQRAEVLLDARKEIGELKDRYREKCEEADRWKDAYTSLARAFFSGKVEKNIEKPEDDAAEEDARERADDYTEAPDGSLEGDRSYYYRGDEL